MKSILHDWSDGECTRILTNLRRAVTVPGRIYVAEFVELFATAGWRHTATYQASGSFISVIAGAAA